MLNYFRETQEARFATPARRMYGYLSAGIVVAVMALVFAGLAPLWISWATFAASCVPLRTLGLEILPRLPVLLRPQRTEGKTHVQAMLSLTRRRLNVLWAMLRDGTTYTPVPALAPMIA
jgi:hypothetical protein